MINHKHKFAILCLLAFFVLGKFLVLLHSFSHIEPTKSIVSLEEKSFFEKIIFSHSSNKTHKNFDDCALCSFSNAQSQIHLIDSFKLLISGFFLVFALRFFNFSRLSFLLTSHSSRAPPAIS
jgi:hypothetical protein